MSSRPGTPDHYQRLGVARDASSDDVRRAYRRAARDAHPDRHGEVSAARMAEVNEAWRVLGDAARRRQYDEQLRLGAHGGAADGVRATSTAGPPAAPPRASSSPPPPLPAPNFPWRFLLFMAFAGIAVVLIAAVFTDPASPPAPDGILRAGDCVRIDEVAIEASEVPCNGPHDGVVRNLVPFGDQCPGDTFGVRDRQGMGIACLMPPAAPDGAAPADGGWR